MILVNEVCLLVICCRFTVLQPHPGSAGYGDILQKARSSPVEKKWMNCAEKVNEKVSSRIAARRRWIYLRNVVANIRAGILRPPPVYFLPGFEKGPF